jgi:sRNA-binding regulator protein Hfq
MSTRAILPAVRNAVHSGPGQFDTRTRRSPQPALPFRYSMPEDGEETAQRQAELFYLQKQIQSQTPMVIVLEDGEHIEGVIEWYDRNSIKVRGRAKTLVYKAAIKYMHKLGEAGS